MFVYMDRKKKEVIISSCEIKLCEFPAQEIAVLSKKKNEKKVQKID